MKKQFTIIVENTFLGFTTKNEGYSVKKMVFAFVVVNLMAFTWYKTDINTFGVVLVSWLGFATGLVAVGAIEKNITAVNETKQTIANPPADGKQEQ
jgi:apolipoprotein N-acyltransferase